ncbi:sigma-54-dependent Fis family transcriptional regulator [bacterium]|nr:sigma-54-dependent Fis family transcriptional regulator [bacterium]
MITKRNNSIEVLIVDDDRKLCDALALLLQKLLGLECHLAHCAQAARKMIDDNDYNIVILDYSLPDSNGFDLYNEIMSSKTCGNSEFILITGHGDIEKGIKALSMGFYDYIPKPFNSDDLVFRVKRLQNKQQLTRQIQYLRKREPVLELLGNSKEIRDIKSIINKVRGFNTPVLIEGETGTGKEVVARLLHQRSIRSDKPFIPLNCAAFSENLLNAELFGYEKGAFTGADKRKYGIFEIAKGGTIYLDEINSASMTFQNSLLRFLDRGEFLRVGGSKIIHSDVRIISSSNKCIETLIKNEKFKEDLYYRLKIIQILIPPIKDRREDISELLAYFLSFYNNKFEKKVFFSKKAEDRLMKYSWPGNVRQLKGALETLVLLNVSGEITVDELPIEIVKDDRFPSKEESENFHLRRQDTINKFERSFLIDMLIKCEGNVSQAAKRSQINRKTFYNKLNALEINPNRYKK